MKNESKKYRARKEMMLSQLQSLCSASNDAYTLTQLPPPESWPKTRELADRCNESIYATRTMLLTLEREGKVYCTFSSINNSLRWFIGPDIQSDDH
ncbi:FaeA/PapI family transcriptional regulator [Yersinia massiliensis]|jgi:hypothetical protein|uniref:FaeA-like family protein n=3 Tax=Yersiniaceae TaxID=1903411 RepID=A0A2R4NL39_9GAMM|nr:MULTISPECIES: FaeA/PapI family transcriptional regulator [Yersinia]HEC1651824.1 hypothetical protein [Yersinia enterocolitica]AVX36816.1 hypothetical protein DA391_03575 [Yersinia massiliensis]MCB5317806.1 FaeA/PapI family transcriptional regulator [Yersinia massiliensis]MDA5548879.1 hypothetical protein [Yersinia massiliensis]MDN0127480.1 FaeA/PapI family transcriptional regulator [Yersinia massiliensis]